MAYPSESMNSTRLSAATPRTVTCTLFGSRRSGWPFDSTPGISDTPAKILSRISRSCRPRSSSSASASLAASPSPTTPATLGVPLLRPPSWPPPKTTGRMGVPSRTYSAPTPCGP